jgi:phage shock protein E
MTMMKLCAVVGLLTFWLCSIALADVEELWIDVRSSEEYSAGHIPGHANIPHGEISLRISELTTDKNARIKLYCRSGRRSGIAVELLQQQGFTNVSNVGGIDEAKAKLAAIAAEECNKDGTC